MKTIIKSIPMLFAVLVLLSSIAVAVQTEHEADKTLSPYFFVQSNDPAVDQLPLKSTDVQVNISGVIADVIVTQVYKNEGQKPLEAVYIFPASTKAAVYGMKMQIGERTIIAKIQEREAARRAYEEAKDAGQSASLLEQQRPNVFQMNVANILPGDVIEVELKYTELLVPADAIYEFVYPTVVGPRYTGSQGDYPGKPENWTANPYLHQGELPKNTLDISVNIAAGLPIQDVSCNTHKTSICFDGKNDVAIKLDESEKQGGNRDFILKYRLAGGKIESGLLLSEGETENFFLLMMQPPKEVKTSEIPPREYIFIVDVSGSMHGFPLDISKKLLRDLIGNLRPTDRFNVMLFAGGATVMSSQSVPATRQNIQRAINVIEKQKGGGGTQLLPALKKALAMPGNEGFSRTFIIATDGYVSVEEETFELIRKNLGEANMFAFGIGSSVNRHLIEGMARVGTGEPFVITKPEEAPEKAAKLRKLIQSPVLTNIKIDYGQFDAYDIEPPGIPDVLAERPVIVFGKWRGKLRGKIKLQGLTGNEIYNQSINVSRVKPKKTNAALHYLWARHRIAVLGDYNRLYPDDERVKEITSLGLTYNLLTAYTSFVAIDSEKRLENGQLTTVRQPLPLPQGVSDYAVGHSGVKMKAGQRYAPITALPGKVYRLKKESDEYKKNLFMAEECRESAAKGLNNIKVNKVEVSKGLSEKAVQEIIEKRLPSINSCIKTSGLPNNITVTVMVDAAGTVTKVEIAQEKKISNDAFKRCLTEKIKKISFPAPGGRKTGEITIIFNIF